MQNQIIGYVPTSVGPTKLELALAQCSDLSDEAKTKICLIQDIVKIAKLMNISSPTAEHFDYMYDQSVSALEDMQYNAQIEFNTWRYRNNIL